MLLSLEVNNIIDNAVRLQWGIEQASDIGSIILPVNNEGESDSSESDSSSEEEESENIDFDQLKAEHCQMETCLKRFSYKSVFYQKDFPTKVRNEHT